MEALAVLARGSVIPNGPAPAEQLGVVAGSVMLKDETRCIRCGLCAMRCPAGTITMEAYNLVPAEPTGLISIAAIDAPFRAPVAGNK